MLIAEDNILIVEEDNILIVEEDNTLIIEDNIFINILSILLISNSFIE